MTRTLDMSLTIEVAIPQYGAEILLVQLSLGKKVE